MTSGTARVARRSASLALSAIAVLGAVSILATVAAMTFHLRPVVIRSGSMSPTIPVGAIVVAQRVPASDVHIGDIVTVPHDGSSVTHRVATITRDGSVATVRLKGDANPVADNELHRISSAYEYRVAVPQAGYVVSWLSRPPGIFALAGLVALLLVVLFRSPLQGRTTRAHRGPRRRGVAVTLAVLLLAGTVVGGTARPTWAAWGDTSTVVGTSLTTTAVPVPATFSCGTIGVLSVTFNWSSVAGATNYTLHFGSGGASTRTVTGTSATITSLISGGTAWVTANVDYGSTTWTSAASNTRTYTVAVVSLCS